MENSAFYCFSLIIYLCFLLRVLSFLGALNLLQCRSTSSMIFMSKSDKIFLFPNCMSFLTLLHSSTSFMKKTWLIQPFYRHMYILVHLLNFSFCALMNFFFSTFSFSNFQFISTTSQFKPFTKLLLKPPKVTFFQDEVLICSETFSSSLFCCEF